MIAREDYASVLEACNLHRLKSKHLKVTFSQINRQVTFFNKITQKFIVTLRLHNNT